MDSFMVIQRLARLERSTGLPESQPREFTSKYSVDDEQSARRSLHNWGVKLPTTSEKISAAIKSQIVCHRVPRTSTCRTVEAAVSETTARFTLPAAAMRMLFDRLCSFFEGVEKKRPAWLSKETQTSDMRELWRHGNQRQQFHAIRELLPQFRELLFRLSQPDQESDTLLWKLGELGLVVPEAVHIFVSTAAFGDPDEILSPPEHLRQIWKPAARERIAPEDRGTPAKYTEDLWRTSVRVRECNNPPVSAAELRAMFGEDVTYATHAEERLPFACGAHKYSLVEDEVFVTSCTNRGLFTTSGPSGTAYRYLNVWRVLGGSSDKLPELRFAMVAALLGGNHHSLVEVLEVCAPIVGCQTPTSWQNMLEQLVPRNLELILDGESHMVTQVAFYSELGNCLDGWLA